MNFRWLSPSGQELWNSSGDLNVGAPPPGVAEMDLPLIAQLDLPMDAAGGYTMAIAIDGESHHRRRNPGENGHADSGRHDDELTRRKIGTSTRQA